jgi:hypothetical protein
MTLPIYKRRRDRRPGKTIALLPMMVLLMVGAGSARAQTTAPAANAASCILAGIDTVTAGSTASFTLGSCAAGNWATSCGKITGQTPGSVTVNFGVSACGSATITATNGGATLATKKVTVVPAPALTAGTIEVPLAVNYKQTPHLISAPAAGGGICGGVYTYQWLSSTDNSNFSPIAGAIGQNYQPGPLTATMYFKRQTNCSGTLLFTSNTVMVAVYPPLAGVSLSPVTQSINYHTAPATLTLSPLNGGSGGLSYQWQSSSNGLFTSKVVPGGAGSSSFTPGNLDSTTYYRVALIRSGDTVYSAAAVVTVFPSLNAGNISPASQVLAYDSVPAPLGSQGVSGGNGTYVYRWYSSPDGSNWSLLSGVATPDYSPGGLVATTWFRVVVSSNGLQATSAAAVVNVNSVQTGQ